MAGGDMAKRPTVAMRIACAHVSGCAHSLARCYIVFQAGPGSSSQHLWSPSRMRMALVVWFAPCCPNLSVACSVLVHCSSAQELSCSVVGVACLYSFLRGAHEGVGTCGSSRFRSLLDSAFLPESVRSNECPLTALEMDIGRRCWGQWFIVALWSMVELSMPWR